MASATYWTATDRRRRWPMLKPFLAGVAVGVILGLAILERR